MGQRTKEKKFANNGGRTIKKLGKERGGGDCNERGGGIWRNEEVEGKIGNERKAEV